MGPSGRDDACGGSILALVPLVAIAFACAVVISPAGLWGTPSSLHALPSVRGTTIPGPLPAALPAASLHRRPRRPSPPSPPSPPDSPHLLPIRHSATTQSSSQGRIAAAAAITGLVAFLTAVVPRWRRSRRRPLSTQWVVATTSGGFPNPFAKRREVPRDIKATVAQVREAVQRALEARQSRLDVELPLGAMFGVEGKDDTLRGPALLERSDRELARLFVEMFQPIEEAVVVAFPDERQAAAAREKWGTIMSRVIVLGGPPRKPPARGGFGTKPAGAPAPPDPATALRSAEVVIVVAPTANAYTEVEKFAAERGDTCCIILVNARLHQATFASAKQEAAIKNTFRPIYYLRPLLVKDGGKEGVDAILMYTYPDGWIVARKPKVGPPVILFEGPALPPPEEVRQLVEEGVPAVDALVDSVAGLFAKRPPK